MELERKSAAVEPGASIAVGTSSTEVFNDTDLDEAVKFYLQNDSDTTIIVRFAADGAEDGAGLVLEPGAVIVEDRYAGAVCAAHVGASGTKDLLVAVI